MMLALNKFLDRAESYPNIGLVTNMVFSLCCQPKLRIQCSSSFSCTLIFKRMSVIFFVNLLKFFVCSRSSTSVALRIGSICIHEFAYIQLSSIIHTFSALCIALKHYFARFRICHNLNGFCNCECGL